MSPSLVRTLSCVLLVIACFASFAPVRHAEFVNYDDNEYVTANPMVLRGLDTESIRWAFTENHSSNWHPLTWISHMIDVELFGGSEESAGAHHLSNVLVHALASVMLAWMGFVLCGYWWPSLLVAALFALHPAHVESVAWVSERKDTLSALLGFATLLAYVRWARRPSAIGYLLVAVLFAAGLMAKPMLVTLPAVMLLLDVWPLRRGEGHGVGWGRRLLEKLPLMAIVIVSVLLTLAAQTEGKAIRNSDLLAFDDRLVNAIVVAVTYLRKLLWPDHFAVFYPHWALSPELEGPAAWQVALSLVLLAGLSALFLAWGRRRDRWMPLVAWLFYLGTLVPVIGLVQVGPQAMADRYTYLPSIGIFALLAAGAWRVGRRGRTEARIVTAVAVLAVLGCAVRTYEQTKVWRTSETLFLHALQVAGPSWVAHNNLGQYYGERGEEERAREHYLEAVRLRPDDPLALYNLANTSVDLGRVEEGVELFRRSLRRDPDNAATLNNLGNALARLGRFDRAVERFERALALDPDLDAARVNLAFGLLVQGRAEESLSWFESLLARRPNHVRGHRGMAEALLLVDPARALVPAARAVELDGGQDPELLEILASALGAAGQLEEATRTLMLARDRYRNLGREAEAREAEAFLRSMQKGEGR